MKKSVLTILISFLFSTVFSQAPLNYYNGTSGLTGAALKSQLKAIITNGHIDNGYNALLSGFQTSDRDHYYENDGTVLDMYSENPIASDPYNFNYGLNTCGSYLNEGDCYNREHVIPQSLFNQNLPMRSDIHFVTPTDGKVNGMRSNFPFGKVGIASFTSLNGSKLGNSVSAGFTGTVFEPVDEFKGDIARMIFYFVTRYETQLSGFSSGNILGYSAYPGLQLWELNLLLAWNTLDPVSPFEIARNNASFVYQGNRNPYIDNSNFVNLVWASQTIDIQPPSIPNNLIANNPSLTTANLSWTASTDNLGVTGYDIFANGVLKATIFGTSTVVQNLNPSTFYNFFVVAKDAAGNVSTQSNTATETTLAQSSGSCGSENFSAIPAITSSYATRIWTNNSITWIATDARTDQTINGKAIVIQNGELTSSLISGGIQNLTLTTQRKFGGNSSYLNVVINGLTVGTVPYNETVTTTTINNINLTGNFIIKLVNPTSSNKVAIDDLFWNCLTLSTSEILKNNEISIYPNPVRNKELFVDGKDLNKILKIDIYDMSGKLILSIINPFSFSNKIDIKGLIKGSYILKLDNRYLKFIIE